MSGEGAADLGGGRWLLLPPLVLLCLVARHLDRDTAGPQDAPALTLLHLSARGQSVLYRTGKTLPSTVLWDTGSSPQFLTPFPCLPEPWRCSGHVSDRH